MAQFPVYDLQGRWIIEGNGVTPTIEVVNPPHSTFNGADAQLEAAIKYLQDKIRNQPITPLVPQAFPEQLMPGVDVTGDQQ